jgi:tetratricopeptide (TPR) repeat protein
VRALGDRRLETINDQQTRTESRARIVEQANACLRSGQYSRALDLLRAAAAEFPNDAELSGLEKLAHDGVDRNAEAQRLITESQELFAQGKSAEALQLLRKAHELDKKNSLARSILANALVEHAHSLVETDWLEAEKLANQALNLNPAHPTAKSILSRIIYQKETSPVSDWVSQARKLQSSGDLFAALAWVAEGLAVHPHEPKLLQIQDEIQRDQEARRRQARRGDLDDLRRMQREIDGADVAAKQALAERIQAIAAKHWTDGEILSIANALLLRLGLVTKESSGGAARSKGSTLILHVPRPSAPKATPVDTSQVEHPLQTSPVQPKPDPPSQVSPTSDPTPLVPPTPVPPSSVLPSPISSASVPTVPAPANKVPLSRVPPGQAPSSKVPPRMAPRGKVEKTPPEPHLPARQAAVVAVSAPAEPFSESSAPAPKVNSQSSLPKQPTRSNAAMLALVSVAAIVLIAATFYFTRRHYTATATKTQESAPAVSVPPVSAPVALAPPVSAPAVSAPTQATPPSLPDSPVSSNIVTGKVAPADHPPDIQPSDVQPRNAQPVDSVRNVGTLLVVAGQDDAMVFLNGKLQPQLTQGGQLRLSNVDLKDFTVQVSKSGFQDPPAQKIRIRKGEQAKLVFNLQPLVRTASLTVRGGAPGTAVLVDQTPVGTVQPDGTLSVSTINPGDHTIELRKERFKPRQFKKHFVVGETISLAAADAALEAAPAELKVTFTPADAIVAISKGDLPTVIRSGVPLSLAVGTYTLTARTTDKITRASTFEVIAGQNNTLDLHLAPNGMSKWDDAGAWKQEGDSFVRKGGGFVLYGVAPASGTFSFSAMLTKGRLLQWVLNYTDANNYVLIQMDENNFYRAVIRNGQKTDEIKIPEKSDKKSFHTLQIRVSPTEIVHVIKHGDRWAVLDRWSQPGANLSQGKFGFYLPGDDQVALSGFSHYADLNIR